MSEKTEAHQRLAEVMARRFADEKARVPRALAFSPLPPRPVQPALSVEERQERAARSAWGKRYISYAIVWWLISLAGLVAWIATDSDPTMKGRIQDESWGIALSFTLLMSVAGSCPLSALLAIVMAIWYWQFLSWKWICAAVIPTGLALFSLLVVLINR